MNNFRLLTGLLAITLSGIAACHASPPAVPLTLEEIFTTAEANSVRLRPALAEIERAEREVEVAKSRRLPDINASIAVGYIGDGFTTDRNFTNLHRAPIPHLLNTAAVSIDQPVYAGGAITAGIELARMRTTAARLASELTKDNLRIELAGLYLDLYRWRNLRYVTQANISRAELVLQQMRARHEQGAALLNDITRYELLLSNLRLQLTQTQNMLDILNRELTRTAGLPDGITVTPDTTLLLRSLPLTSEDDWQRDAEGNSIRLKLARSGIEISRQAEKLSKAGRLPRIGLRAGWSMDGPILVEVPPINANLGYWNVGVGISWNVSSLFKTNREVAVSKAATESAIATFDAEEESVSLGVHAAYIRYMESYETLKTREKSVELAESNYRIVTTRFEADMALITDMLDAANSCLEAERSLADARADIVYNYYKLLFISGKI